MHRSVQFQMPMPLLSTLVTTEEPTAPRELQWPSNLWERKSQQLLKNSDLTAQANAYGALEVQNATGLNGMISAWSAIEVNAFGYCLECNSPQWSPRPSAQPGSRPLRCSGSPQAPLAGFIRIHSAHRCLSNHRKRCKLISRCESPRHRGDWEATTSCAERNM